MKQVLCSLVLWYHYLGWLTGHSSQRETVDQAPEPFYWFESNSRQSETIVEDERENSKSNRDHRQSLDVSVVLASE